MEKGQKRKSIYSATTLMALAMVSLFGCGQKVTGTYTLTQLGGPFQSYSGMQQCQQISIPVNENSNAISGNGSNQCYTEILMGTNNGNGQMTVTLTLIQNGGAASGMGMTGMYNAGSGSCTYQGTITVSGTSVQGSLNPAQTSTGYGCTGNIILTGTRN